MNEDFIPRLFEQSFLLLGAEEMAVLTTNGIVIKYM